MFNIGRRSGRLGVGIAAIVAVSALALTGCSSSSDSGSTGEDGGTANLSITFLPKNLGNPYFDTSNAGGEEAISEFPGCAIVITHDRYFLDRVATHIIGFEGEGRVEFCTGSWDLYAEQRAQREAAGGAGPSQAFKHRKIERTR